MRIRVRVPEAYLLLRPLDATRPGLLVLDADGRRVDCVALPGMGAPDIDSATVAKRLRAARTATAVEFVRGTVKGSAPSIAGLQAGLAAWEGVGAVRVEDGTLLLTARPGAAPPAALAKLAGSHDVELELQHPVRVTPRKTIPVAWYEAEGAAWVASYALDAGETDDLEAHVFALPDVSRGGPGARVAAAPLAVPGVVAVFPDLFDDAERVVARRGAVDWEKVRAAFAAAGCEAREKG